MPTFRFGWMGGLVLRPARESDADTMAATEIAVLRPCRRLGKRALTGRRRASPAGASNARGARHPNEGVRGGNGVSLRYVRGRTYHPAMGHRREAEELLLIEEADAWFEYLEATRGQTEPRYREVEPWAYARLSQRLRAVRTKRAKLRPAAEAA